MKHASFLLALGALWLLGSPALAADPPRFTDWGLPENLGCRNASGPASGSAG